MPKIFDAISPIKFWIQKVMPLVYDDSLSLYELVCKTVDKLNEVISIVNPLGEGIDGYLEQFAKDQEAKIAAQLGELRTELQAVINQNNETLNQRFTELQTQVNTKLDGYDAEIEKKLQAMETKLLAQIAIISASVAEVDSANRTWTLAQIKASIDALPKEYPPIVDPTDGQLENIQTVINHLYDSWRENALTADEYDALQLTADAYDAYQLTANQYDKAGKVLLEPMPTSFRVNGMPIKMTALKKEDL